MKVETWDGTWMHVSIEDIKSFVPENADELRLYRRLLLRERERNALCAATEVIRYRALKKAMQGTTP